MAKAMSHGASPAATPTISSNSCTHLDILIAGGGIAGPVAAYWLARAGANVTIVERSSSPRKTGQSIDVRGPGVALMRKMGLEETIKANGTHEKGMYKVNAKGQTVASLDAAGDNLGPTSEYEILRGDLARIFTDFAETEGVKIIYGEYISNIDQEEKGRVTATFTNGMPTASYDLLIGADGQGSRTRSMVRGKPARDDFYELGAATAYFSLPIEEGDSTTHARWYTAPRSRHLAMRPYASGKHQGAAMVVTRLPRDNPFATARTADAQKALYVKHFADAGWEAQRIIDQMYKADDFYANEIVQVRIDHYCYGRVALLGDAAWTLSVFTGAGTTTAMYGAYVLAGEIASQPHDIDSALGEYERKMREYILPQQPAPMHIVRLLSPESGWGVSMLNFSSWALTSMYKSARWLKLDRLFTRVFAGEFGPEDREELPYDYQWDGK